MLSLGPSLFDLLNAEQHVGNKKRVVYGKGGMQAYEVENVESQLGFRLPADFKYLLMNMRDDGGVFFPWAKFSRYEYDETINWILGGIEFDVENNVFWLDDRWGARPEDVRARKEIVRRDFASWPKLVPVCGHRFLAAEPCQPGNPVFSIMQTDVIYYGANLAHYLVHEFIPGEDHAAHTSDLTIRQIDVWAELTG